MSYRPVKCRWLALRLILQRLRVIDVYCSAVFYCIVLQCAVHAATAVTSCMPHAQVSHALQWLERAFCVVIVFWARSVQRTRSTAGHTRKVESSQPPLTVSLGLSTSTSSSSSSSSSSAAVVVAVRDGDSVTSRRHGPEHKLARVPRPAAHRQTTTADRSRMFRTSRKNSRRRWAYVPVNLLCLS